VPDVTDYIGWAILGAGLFFGFWAKKIEANAERTRDITNTLFEKNQALSERVAKNEGHQEGFEKGLMIRESEK